MNMLLDKRIVKVAAYMTVILPSGRTFTCGNNNYEIDDVNIEELRKLMHDSGTYRLDDRVEIWVSREDENNIVASVKIDGETMLFSYGTKNGSDEAWEAAVSFHEECSKKNVKKPSNKNIWCDVIIFKPEEIISVMKSGELTNEMAQARELSVKTSRLLSEIYFSM